jgi:hypothetical protein
MYTPDQLAQNADALENPRAGDYWNEMFCPYFLVVAVYGDNIQVLDALPGDNCAKVENSNDTWGFDYSKSIIVDRAWMKKRVTYSHIDGFVANVYRDGKNHLAAVEEWKEFTSKQAGSKQIDKVVEQPLDQSLVFRLKERARIRRQAYTRKSVQEGKKDRISFLLYEAADEIERLSESKYRVNVI